MGLSVVHGIVKAHGGAITVQSDLRKSSTFNIFLPVIEKTPEREIPVETTFPTGTESILFIDDEILLVCLGKQILISTYPKHGTDKASLLAAVDKALYRAKESGCDRVCVA